MANEYLYGAYGRLGQTIARNAVQAGTVPVYVGTAPVNLVKGYKKHGIVNTPVKLMNLPNAQQTIGYSDDWNGSRSARLCRLILTIYWEI